MQFRMDRDQLVGAVDVARLAVTKDPGVITSAILFEVPDEHTDFVYLKSSTKRQCTVVACPLTADTTAELGEDGNRFTLDAKSLYQWASNAFGDVVEVSRTGSEVRLTCGKAEAHFRTLDPDAFPSFETTLAESQLMCEAPASVLQAAIAFTKGFLPDKVENTNSIQPRLQAVKGYDDYLMGTDSKMLAIYRSDGLTVNPELQGPGSDTPLDERAGLEVGKEDVNNLNAYLKKVASQKVSVLVHDNMIFYQSEDGTVFGYTRPLEAPPLIQGWGLGHLDSDTRFVVSSDDIARAVKVLTATADPSDKALSVVLRGSEGMASLELSMTDVSRKHKSTIEVSCTREDGETDEVPFVVNHSFLTQALSQFSDRVQRISLKPGKYLKIYSRCDTTGDEQQVLLNMRKG